MIRTLLNEELEQAVGGFQEKGNDPTKKAKPTHFMATYPRPPQPPLPCGGYSFTAEASSIRQAQCNPQPVTYKTPYTKQG